MTDADLLAMLSEKSPREFTPAELAALRERWPQSPEVRQALLDHLQLETNLVAALADVTVTVDDLLARSARQPRRSRVWSGAWWLLGGLVATALGLWWLRAGSHDSQPATATSIDTPSVVDSRDTPAAAAPEAAQDREPSAAAALNAAQPAPPKSEPKPVAAPEPWSPWLLPDVRPFALGSTRMIGDLKAIGHDELPLDEFRRWWTEAPGQAGHWNQSIIGQRRTVLLNGAARLQAPWLPDTWLRITPFEVHDFALQFWTGETGVVLQFYRHREPHLWAAFAVQRQSGARTPQRWGLLGTDSGKVYRSGVATLEFHHHAGRLVMSVAQTPVLTVPLERPPEEVFLQGQLRLRGVSWVRADPLPERESVEHRVAWSASSAAPIAWESVGKEPPSMETAADGSLRLRAEPSKELVAGLAKLPQAGLYEVVFRVAEGDPGTGVVLGDAAGQPIALLGLLRERRTRQLTLAGLRPDERRVETEYDAKAFPPPYLANQWVRLTAGLGTLQISVSGDGRHWGQVVESPVRDVRGAVQSVGLFALPSDTPRSISVRELHVRALDALEALADLGRTDFQSVRPEERAGGLEIRPTTLARWQQLALDKRPNDLSTAAWLDAFAVATLQTGPAPELAAALTDRLADSAATRPWSASQIWRCFDDQLQLDDHWSERDAATWSARYAALGRKSASTTVREAWAAWLQSPLWTHGTVRDEFYRGMTNELLELAERKQWTEADRASRFALHLVSAAHPDQLPRDAAKMLEQIARWSRGVSGEVDVTRRDVQDDVFPTAWRHPFTPQLDKDAYNTRAELQAALDGAAYRDAVRIAMSLGESTPAGLLPDVREPNLFVSLPVALARAWRDHPEFADTMRREATETGLLRVRLARERADVDAVRAIALQFFGTAAATEAHEWLGDRRMALGDFAAAWQCYERALSSASDRQRAPLQPKREFARALTGPLPGEPQTAADRATNVVLNGEDLSAAVRELRPTSPSLSTDLLANPPPIPPQRYRLEPRARFDGQSGNNAGQGEFREADAFGRQFAVAADDQRVYVSNRFQVTAYDRARGQSQWAVAVGSEQGNAHAHRFTPMTPLVVDNALYARRLTKAGLELACLDATSGNVRWHGRPGDRGQWLSDPVWTAGGLLLLAMHKLDDEWLELRWSRVDPETGQVTSDVPLFRLRDAWQTEVPCRLSVRGWSVVAAVGGTVAHFGLDGEVHWIRQELWLPPKIDPLVDDHLLLAPLLSDADVIVSQPASRSVQCFDLASGQTRWKQASAGLQGVLGVTLRHVVFAEKGAIGACDRMSGELQWRRSIDRRLTAVAANAEHVMVARELESKNNRAWLQLMWLDPATGTVVAEMPVEADLREDWRFGPWFGVGDQVWSFAGQSWRDPNRDVVALSPVAESAAGPWDDAALGVWQTTLPNNERRAAQTVLPGWCPFTTAKDALSLASGEVRGRTPVLVSRLKKDEELQFLRHLAVPEQGAASLFLRVGHQPGQSWKLHVRVDARVVVDQTVDESVSANGWVEQLVALGPSTGRTILVQVAQRSAGDKSAEGLWHQLQIRSQ